MQIQVNAADIQSSQALTQHIEQTLSHAMRSVGEQITRVEVHLRDDNSPDKQGPRDKRCVMEARPAGGRPFVVEQTGDDLYAVVKQAADRLRRAAQRRLESS